MKKSGLAERLHAHVGGYIPLRLRDHEVEGELNIFVLSQTEILLFLFLIKWNHLLLKFVIIPHATMLLRV